MEGKRQHASLSTVKAGAFKPAEAGAVIGERRSRKRRASSQLKLTFLGVEHEAMNWSADGVMLNDRHPDVPVGTKVEGVITVAGLNGRYRFAGEIVRRDKRAQEMGLRFINPSRALLEALARISE